LSESRGIVIRHRKCSEQDDSAWLEWGRADVRAGGGFGDFDARRALRRESTHDVWSLPSIDSFFLFAQS